MPLSRCGNTSQLAPVRSAGRLPRPCISHSFQPCCAAVGQKLALLGGLSPCAPPAVQLLGLSVSRREVEAMLAEVDRDGSGGGSTCRSAAASTGAKQLRLSSGLLHSEACRQHAAGMHAVLCPS